MMNSRDIGAVNQHVVYKREAALLSSVEQSLEEQLIQLNEEPINDDFCDVSKSIDATDELNKAAGALCFRLLLFA
uniref:Uncharacterized protein n=1 Tax=Parascaris equorum TaxID=6256 RepID=A0A914SDK8_PAREQ